MVSQSAKSAIIAPEEVIGSFYRAAYEPQFWPDALDAIAACFMARGALLPTAHFEPDALPHSRGMGDVLQHFFEEGWHLHDQRTFAAQRRARAMNRTSALITDQDLFTPEDIEKSRYYEGFARAAGVPWFCAVNLSGEIGGEYRALSLQRTMAQGMFEPSDQRKLAAMLPHLRNALALAERLLERRMTDLLEGLEQSGIVAALVLADGRILKGNAGFEGFSHPALSLRGGRIKALRQRDQRLLADLLGAMAADPPQLSAGAGPIALWAEEASPPLILQAAPFRAGLGADIGAGFGRGLGPEAILLTLKDLAREIRPKAEELRALFQLTPREAEIMALIGRGQSLAQIALLLHLSKETVRFHLKAILGKTALHRQSELVALCHRLS